MVILLLFLTGVITVIDERKLVAGDPIGHFPSFEVGTLNVFLRIPALATRYDDSICISHLKQLGLATKMYAQDWDNHLPPASSWCDALADYVQSEAVFDCEFSVINHRYLVSSVVHKHRGKWGYAFSRYMDGKDIIAIDNPERSLLIFDYSNGSLWDMEYPKNNSIAYEPLCWRHQRGLNFLFADGHVVWLRWNDKRLWSPKEAPYFH